MEIVLAALVAAAVAVAVVLLVQRRVRRRRQRRRGPGAPSARRPRRRRPRRWPRPRPRRLRATSSRTSCAPAAPEIARLEERLLAKEESLELPGPELAERERSLEDRARNLDNTREELK